MKKYFAEFIGTFALVLVGTGAIVLHEEKGWPDHLGISVAFGLIVFLMILLLGKISGAHINPAVTISFAIKNKSIVKTMSGYLFAQLSGAITASFCLKIIFPDNEKLGTTLPSGSIQESFLLEFLMTFMLIVSILVSEFLFNKKVFPVAVVVGMVIFAEAYFGGPLTGASMNPARSFGPAVASGHLEYLWIYFLAPITGAMLAIFVSKLNFIPKNETT